MPLDPTAIAARLREAGINVLAVTPASLAQDAEIHITPCTSVVVGSAATYMEVQVDMHDEANPFKLHNLGVRCGDEEAMFQAVLKDLRGLLGEVAA